MKITAIWHLSDRIGTYKTGITKVKILVMPVFVFINYPTILPKQWKYPASSHTRKQFEILKKLIWTVVSVQQMSNLFSVWCIPNADAKSLLSDCWYPVESFRTRNLQKDTMLCMKHIGKLVTTKSFLKHIERLSFCTKLQNNLLTNYGARNYHLGGYLTRNSIRKKCACAKYRQVKKKCQNI